MESLVLETLPQPFAAFLPRKSNGAEGQTQLCGHFGILTRWSLQKKKFDQPPALRAERGHGAGTILTALRTVCDMQILEFKKNAHAMTRASLLSLPTHVHSRVVAGNMHSHAGAGSAIVIGRCSRVTQQKTLFQGQVITCKTAFVIL